LDEGYLAGIVLGEGYEGTDLEGAILSCATERRTRAEIDAFVACVDKAARS
jgi:hypothetical protein